MSYISPTELIELVPVLQDLASTETSEEVRAALMRLADRYAAMAGRHQDALVPA
jgi:hypothetical protein